MARETKRQKSKRRSPQPIDPISIGNSIGKKNKITLAFVALGGIVTVIVGVMLAGYSYLNYRFVKAGDSAEPQPIVFTVPRGAGMSRIAADLESQGLIDSAFIFKAVTRLRKVDNTLKAGEYSLDPNGSMEDVFTILSEGKALLYPVTAPEGLTSAQFFKIIASAPNLTGEMPEPVPEGVLLPETYMTPRGMSREALIAKMRSSQSAYIDALWDGRADDLPFKTKREAIILASVVEKETGVNSERGLVAGVFVNRLKRGIRLQSDPTIIYGITKGEKLGRGIRVSEIARKTDWNTYQMDGLPKTPICNPGGAAIAAVLNPMQTDMIFFVTDGSGGHVFSKTNAEHEKYVRALRAREKAAKRAAQQR
ncbi:MAG: endolytic transglycosylase MltG [Robiginitomaculum sp.]